MRETLPGDDYIIIAFSPLVPFRNVNVTPYPVVPILKSKAFSSLFLAPLMFTLNLGHSARPPPELDAVAVAFFGNIPGGRAGSP